MGMRIQGGSYGAAEQMQWQQRRQNFDALSQAISSGNLAGAKDAFAKIQSQMSGGNINPDSFLGKLGAALQSGDITSAQQILAARQSRDGSQTAGSAQASAASDASTTSANAASGHRHHHHGGGASLGADLSQAIQSGDTAKAQSTMQTIVADLQQLASLANPTGASGSASGYGSLASSAASAAQKLLQNSDFQALEDAVTKGDVAGMKTAWSNLIGGASSSTPAAATAASSTQVAA